jgi:urease accessory protein
MAMKLGTQFAWLSAGVVILAAASSPAFAHHVMDGKTPTTFLEGLLSGFGHPVIEVPLLAAILLAGAVGARLGDFAFVALFVAGSFLGTAVLGLEFPLPLGETLVFASLALLVAMLLLGSRARGLIGTAALFAIGGIHGAAFAESIVGAETSPLAAYLLGLALMECVLAGAIFIAISKLSGGRARDAEFGK